MNVGGTTRNVAECLGRLGVGQQVTFISNIGDDEFSGFVRNSLTSVGVSAENLFVK
jgi:sugar/nucleoside kinase (ribokinase family)